MNLVRRKRIIVCKDHRFWSSILLDIYKRVQNTTELAKKNKNVTPQQITELTDTMKRLEKEVVRYVNYIRQPDKKTPDYAKYLKSLRDIHESLNEINEHLDKREQRLRQIELYTRIWEKLADFMLQVYCNNEEDFEDEDDFDEGDD